MRVKSFVWYCCFMHIWLFQCALSEFLASEGSLRKHRKVLMNLLQIEVWQLLLQPSPTSLEFAELQALIESVSLDGGKVLINSSSLWYKELEWLAGNVNLDDYPDWKRHNDILFIFYFSTNGDDWLENSNWLLCTWATFSIDPVCQPDGEFWELANHGYQQLEWDDSSRNCSFV